MLSEAAANSPPPPEGQFVDHLEEVTAMIDFRTAKMRGHRRNIARYCRLLATELTDLERQYLHKRIAKEHAQLKRLEKSEAEQQADVVVTAEALGNRAGGQSHV
jgi:hypothetical protein